MAAQLAGTPKSGHRDGMVPSSPGAGAAGSADPSPDAWCPCAVVAIPACPPPACASAPTARAPDTACIPSCPVTHAVALPCQFAWKRRSASISATTRRRAFTTAGRGMAGTGPRPGWSPVGRTVKSIPSARGHNGESPVALSGKPPRARPGRRVRRSLAGGADIRAVTLRRAGIPRAARRMGRPCRRDGSPPSLPHGCSGPARPVPRPAAGAP